ncbi:MAG: peptidyl-tRNA hydrolase, partial [Ignavibacteriales bacterium]|nr:peptidyl-tRNA hydrolase [Ignavibacteriales bacterium]
MRILVGLGNPGIRYRQTRHNIGFDVVEAVAAHHRTQWQSGKGEYEFAQCSLNDVPFV